MALQEVVLNALPYQAMLETERAVFAMRQFIAHNLYDRVRCVTLLGGS